MVTFSENRGQARTFLPTLFDIGLSSGKALGFLQAQNLGYRKTDFLEDWREVTGFAKKKDTFKYIRKDYKPDVKTLSVTSENLSKEYSYIAKVGAQSKITGEIEYHEWRYATDKLISVAEAEAAVTEETEEPYVAELEWEHISVEIIGCKKRMVL